MTFGETLRAAREAKGMTASELAAETHILVQIVEGLENNNFKRIPALIYGRSFVKMYCEAVGIEPKPLVAEFADLYTGKKSVAEPVPPAPAAPPHVPAAPEPPAEETPAPVAETVTEEAAPVPPPKVSPFRMPRTETVPVQDAANQHKPVQMELGDAPVAPPPPPPPPAAPAPARPASAASAAPHPRRAYGDIFGHAYAQEEEKPSAVERFRSTMSNVSSGVFSNVKKLPPNTGRIATVAVCGVVALVLIGWSVSALYKATTPSAEEDEKPASASTALAEKPEAKDKPAGKETKEPKKNTEDKKPSGESNKSAPAAKTTASAVPDSASLKTSGIEIPPLYID